MYALKSLLIFAVVSCVYSQQYNQPTTTPVPILKQINRQNDDGSYSFGYEAADGSFKIETKYPNGDVAGKYGYIDEGGKQREISYGASSQRGFEPEGPGIMVPPPTQNDPKVAPSNLAPGEEDDGQYREDPRIYEDPKYNGKSSIRPSANFNFESAAPQPQKYQPKQSFTQNFQPSTFRSSPLYTQTSTLFNQAPQQFSQPAQPQYQQQQYQQPQYQQPQYQQPQYQQPQYQQPQYQQEYRPQSQVFHQQPKFSYSGYTQPQQNNYQPQYSGYNPNQNYNPFQGHPATNFDPTTGSYTINFTG